MRLPRPRPWWAAAAIALFALFVAFEVGLQPRKEAARAVPDTLRALGAAVVLFGLTGLGPTRLLLPESLRRYELLWVLPVGACASSLALTALGFAGVPFTVNLAVVLAVGAALSAYALRRLGPPPAGRHLGWPAFLGVVVVFAALIPMVMVMHMATVSGTGSDAHMAAGSAHFLQHAYPTAIEPELPVDRMPLLWKSKFAIYYAFGGVAQLAGLETWQVLAPLIAALLAFAAMGMFLLARDVLGASAGVAACAMGFAGLGRMVLHTGLNPYFNQSWGYMAMPFAIVLAWWLVRPGEAPSQRKRTAALLAAFLAVLAFAYPLALPFALIPLAVFAWRERRQRVAEGRPVPRLRSLYRGPLSLLYLVPGVLVLLVPLRGVNEKVVSATQLLLDPTQSLIGWGGDMLAFVPAAHFFNLPDHPISGVLLVAVVVLAFRELRRQPRGLAVGVGVVLAFGLLAALLFRQRQYGYYFHFKLLAFVAPLLLVLAAVHIGRRRSLAPALLVAFAVATAVAAWQEVDETGQQLGPNTIELARWADELPADSSVRLDMDPPLQLWANYFLSARRTCSQMPLLGTDYPSVQVSRRADFIVVHFRTPVPADALQPPLHSNVEYALYRMSPLVPLPDTCSFAQRSRIGDADIPG